MPEQDPIREHFTKRIDDYDSCCGYVVPENGELHDRLVTALPFDPSKPIRVLDLGSGTGHGMKLVMERFSRAYVIGVDFSGRMIAKSRQNLQGYGGRFELIEDDFNYLEFPRQFDGVISAVAIHNSYDEQKGVLFRKIRSCLKQGGVFVNGDFIKGETADEDRAFREFYEAFLRRHLEGEELEVWLKHAFEEDKPAKLSEQEAWLREAGFSSMGVLWKHENVVVYRALRDASCALGECAPASSCP